MDRHTPGPWIIRASDRAIVPISDPSRLVAHGGSLQPGDARLVAAAPELLSALRRVTHPMADETDLNDALELLRRMEV